MRWIIWSEEPWASQAVALECFVPSHMRTRTPTFSAARSRMGHEDPSRIGTILAHDLVHVGASDGGAHIQSFATYGDTGYLFSEFVRAGHHLGLEHAVRKITGDTARIWGLPERGLLQPGMAADVVVFDPDTIARGDELPARDMPEGGMRYVRSARGVDTVIVNGEIVGPQRAATPTRVPA